MEHHRQARHRSNPDPRRGHRSGHRLTVAAVALVAAVFVLAVVGPDSRGASASSTITVDAPWRAAGLTEREAAAYALDRFAFGARPGEVDRVVAVGVDVWLARQLEGARAAATAPDRRVERYLEDLESLDLSAAELASRYLGPPQIIRRAVAEGVVEQPSPDAIAAMQSARDEGRRAGGGVEQLFSPEEQRKLRRWAEAQGLRLQRRALDELRVQKIVRAAWSEAQLHEVLVDFWFNHFNVSITDTQARVFVWPYERDAIRPHVVGSFRSMLEETASHPAMLFYLDNARSIAGDDQPTTLEAKMEARARGGRFGGDRARQRMLRRFEEQKALREAEMDRRGLGGQRPAGLNENYARELLELHTLGVDGGYTQDDVIEVARAFTGWAAVPAGFMNRDVERRIERARRNGRAGFVVDEGFIFRADVHDAGPKTVLGTRLPAGRGIEDGRQVLDLLAVHPSTARHLARKLAVRFVSDDPPESLVDRLAATWLEHDGELLEVMVTLVESPETWSDAARHEKIKSPFEVAISSVRALGAEPTAPPRELLEWIERMGQPLYAYQAPTGYPDRADHWVNTGALLNRMNFGLALATGGVRGLEHDLAALRQVGAATKHREPASLEEALAVYVPLLLPGRDAAETIERLLPVAADPELESKLSEAAPEPAPSIGDDPAEAIFTAESSRKPLDAGSEGAALEPPGPGRGVFDQAVLDQAAFDDRALARVVGVILGSPDFQRR